MLVVERNEEAKREGLVAFTGLSTLTVFFMVCLSVSRCSLLTARST